MLNSVNAMSGLIAVIKSACLCAGCSECTWDVCHTVPVYTDVSTGMSKQKAPLMVCFLFQRNLFKLLDHTLPNLFPSIIT